MPSAKRPLIRAVLTRSALASLLSRTDHAIFLASAPFYDDDETAAGYSYSLAREGSVTIVTQWGDVTLISVAFGLGVGVYVWCESLDRPYVYAPGVRSLHGRVISQPGSLSILLHSALAEQGLPDANPDAIAACDALKDIP